MKLPTLPPFFDLDFSINEATVQHYVGCLILCALLDIIMPTQQAVQLTVAFSAFYEAGQWDTARGLPQCHQGDQLAAPFRPGYGFGVMDMIANLAGAATWAYLLLPLARLVIH